MTTPENELEAPPEIEDRLAKILMEGAVAERASRGGNPETRESFRFLATFLLAAAKEHGLVIGEGAEYQHRVARVVARLPRMLTEADDYSWVPLGDVFIALNDVETAELVWPNEGDRLVLDTLRRHALECPPLKEVSGTPADD